MKNHWLELHRSKQTQIRLEFIGLFPSCKVEIRQPDPNSTIYAGPTLATDDPEFKAWLLKATSSFKSFFHHDAFDGMIEVYDKGSLIESWVLMSIKLIGYTYMVDGPCRITFTCANPTTIKSKFIKF